MSEVFAGELSISVGGVNFATKANVRVQKFNRVKESIVGLDGFHGYRKVPAAARVTATFSATNTAGNLFYEALRDYGDDGNGVLTITPVSGAGTALSTQVLTCAGVVGELDVMLDQGEYEVVFEGDRVRDA